MGWLLGFGHLPYHDWQVAISTCAAEAQKLHLQHAKSFWLLEQFNKQRMICLVNLLDAHNIAMVEHSI